MSPYYIKSEYLGIGPRHVYLLGFRVEEVTLNLKYLGSHWESKNHLEKWTLNA